MGATALKTSHRAPEATIDKDGKKRIAAYYQVTVDDGNDGPDTVLGFLESRGIAWGSIYQYGNEVNNSVFCDGITPRRKPGSIYEWEIGVSYGPMDTNVLQQDHDSQPSETPSLWKWRIDTSYATWQMPAWKAWNTTEFPHPDQLADKRRSAAYSRNENTYGPIVNSANVVLDPTLMRDVYDHVVQITTYGDTYDSYNSDTYMGHINSAAVKWSAFLQDKYGFVERSFAKYVIKCTHAGATYREFDRDSLRVGYWEWLWEFRFRDITWLEEVLDRGNTCRPGEGKPTGALYGGSSSYPDDLLEDHEAAVEAIKDSDGRRVSELVNLDGAGYPLHPDDANHDTGYFFGWRLDEEVDFVTIPFDFFVAA